MGVFATSRGRAFPQAAGFSIDDLGRAGAKAIGHWGREGSRVADRWMQALTQPQQPAPSAPRHYQTIRTVSPENRVMTSKDYARADARKRAAATPGVMRAFNNGASFNTIDEIDAFGASLETGLNNFGKRLGLTQGAPYSMQEAYDAVHAAEAEATAAYARRKPIVSGVATGVGAAANPLNKVGVGWVARGGSLGNVAARSAVLGGLNGAASGAGEGNSLEERTANARNGAVFGAVAGGATPYVVRGLGTAAQSVAKAAGPRVQALADQIPPSVMRAYDDVLRKGSDVFARGWPPRRPAVVDAVLDAPPLSSQGRMVGEDLLTSVPPRLSADSLSTTDFIAGRLGGKLYSPSKLSQLNGYLGRRGIAMQVGDEFLPAGKAGGFDAAERRLALRNDPTEYEVWHELNHYLQYRRLGLQRYNAQSRAEKEQYVFDALENSRKRWEALTPEQRQHAVDYIYRVGGIR